VLHNLGVAIGLVAPMSARGGWLNADQAFSQASMRDGPWKGMSAARHVAKQWIKLMDREQFGELQRLSNTRVPSYLDEQMGVRRVGMLVDTGYYAVADFAAIQLAQFVQGCAPAAAALVQDDGYDPEGIHAPEERDRVVHRAAEGGDPVVVPFSHQIVRAWFGERGHDWAHDRGFDVTPIALGHQHVTPYVCCRPAPHIQVIAWLQPVQSQ